MVSETEYDESKLLLETNINKYYDYDGRASHISFDSILAIILADYNEAVLSGLTQEFLDSQTIVITHYVNFVNNLLTSEIELDIIPAADDLYFSGTFNPLTQDTTNYIIQSRDLVSDVSTLASSSLTSTMIANTPRNIVKYVTEVDYFSAHNINLRDGVFETTLYASTTAVSEPYPIVYMQLFEVQADGTTQVGTAIASGTSRYGTTIKSDDIYKVYLKIPAYTITTDVNRLQLLLWAVNSDGSATNVDLKIKMNTTTLSKTHTTLLESEIIGLGPVGPTGARGRQGATGATGPIAPLQITNHSLNKSTLSGNSWTRDAYTSNVGYVSQLLYCPSRSGYAHIEFTLPNGVLETQWAIGLLASTQTPLASNTSQYTSGYFLSTTNGTLRYISMGVNTTTSLVYTGTDVLSVKYEGTVIEYAKNGIPFATVTVAANLLLQAKLEKNILSTDSTTRLVATNVRSLTSGAPAIAGIINCTFANPPNVVTYQLTNIFTTIPLLFCNFTPNAPTVLVEFTCMLHHPIDGQATNQFALSGHASENIYSEWTGVYSSTTTGTEYTGEGGYSNYREPSTFQWILDGLTPGQTYNICPAIRNSSATVIINMKYGGNGTERFPPLVFKITQLDPSWGCAVGSGET
jgi:hypothetical protein